MSDRPNRRRRPPRRYTHKEAHRDAQRGPSAPRQPGEQSTVDAIPMQVVRNMIVNGLYTRERACDEKVRFGQLAHAMKAKSDLEAKHGDPGKLCVYPCPFCAGWHLATSTEFRDR